MYTVHYLTQLLLLYLYDYEMIIIEYMSHIRNESIVAQNFVFLMTKMFSHSLY